MALAVVVAGLGWWRYRSGIRYPSSLTTYSKSDGLTYLKSRRRRPVY
ncbi:hypothetical protein MMOR_10330 [Mycolicibacterium moriokaense]|uniref:Uncharacterized protein n=1 Tax=Mycolicibacterium moriokaense TaxID=39691 RepID=A0AAD1H728_9MYCO|nr:hypothetical protein MMOR_10330 [Mycolicibacterium moriokaense]